MPHIPFITTLIESDRQTCMFYTACLVTGVILGLMVSFQYIRKLWTILKTQHVTKARVVEMQRRPMARYTEYAQTPDDVGDLSFGNGVLDDYTIWLEIMDKSLVRQLGILTVCGMNGFEYRERWDEIPKHTEALICLEKKQDDETGRVDWNPKWMDLCCDTGTGEFVVYKE